MRYVLCLINVMLALSGWSQIDSMRVEVSTPVQAWEKSLLRNVGKIAAPNRDEVLRQLDWQWQCLGPERLPQELNPGGKAIPAYSVNRGNGTGRINFLYQHPHFPNYLWACSPTGGMWITQNEGETWHNAGTDALPISGVSSVAVDPNCTSRWALATGDGDDLLMFTDGVWLTNDCGQHYERINGEWEFYSLPYGETNDAAGQISDIEADPRAMDYLIVAGNRGLFMSKGDLSPSSVKWNKVANGQFYEVIIIPQKKKKQDIIIASGEKMVASFDAGKSWVKMPQPAYPMSKEFPFLRIKISYSPTRPDYIMAAVTCSEANSQSLIGEATLQEFNLKTKEWKLIRSLKKDMNNVIPSRARAFCVSPTDSLVLFCANVQPIFKSTDGGIQFNKVAKNEIHDDCHFITISPDGKTVWASTDGGVNRSTDLGVSWHSRDKGIGAANVFGVSTAQTFLPQVAYGAYDTGGNLLKDGEWWHVNWGDGFETISHPADSNVIITSMQNGGLFRAINGQDFNTSISPMGQKTEWHSWIRQHPVYHNMIFCAGQKLMRSNDLGDSWEVLFECPKLDSSLVNAYRFFFAPDHPGVMYVYVLDKTHIQPQIWRSFNITQSNKTDIKWEALPPVPVEGWLTNIVADPADPSKFWVLYNKTEKTEKLWYFNGSEYIDQTLNLGSAKCESMVLQRGNDKRLYIGSNYGVFTKSANESQWTLLRGLPGTFIKSLDINYKANKLVVGTFGRGIWWGDLMRK